jgi:YHS domain-containing protein
MIAIRKFGWSVLVLAAFAGCGKQEPGPATPPSDTAPVSGNPAPETPPPATPSSEMKSEPFKGTTSTPDLPKEGPAIEAPQPTPATKDEKKPGEAAAVSLSGKEVAEIKKLPTGEAEQALKQTVCPISGGHLGAMGVPFKVTAAGRTFFLCCDGCEEDLKANPAAVVAKLKK